MLMFSQGLLWIVVLFLAVAVLALTRQVGVLHERIAPVGALAMGREPQPGEAAPKVAARTLGSAVLNVGGALLPGTMQLLFFVSPTCPVCKNLLPTAKAFAETESLDLVLVGDGDVAELRKLATRFGISYERAGRRRPAMHQAAREMRSIHAAKRSIQLLSNVRVRSSTTSPEPLNRSAL